jgi:hypothetical protein
VVGESESSEDATMAEEREGAHPLSPGGVGGSAAERLRSLIRGRSANQSSANFAGTEPYEVRQ